MPESWMPTRYTPPLSEDFPTDGDMLIDFANMAWTAPEVDRDEFRLYEFQEWLLRHVLERYPEDYPDKDLAGQLRYTQCIISMGRQNSKSVIGALLGLYSLIWKPGANVIGVAQTKESADIVYKRVLLVINSNPALKALFGRTSETRGISSKDLRKNYHVKPNKESALQGIPITACIFDEAHLIPKPQYAALVLGTTATQGHIYAITTAGDESSELLADLYKTGADAIAGKEGLERFGFFCWEAPEACKVDDPDAIIAANPAVAEGHISLEQVQRDILTIPEREARRYRLNQFVEGTEEMWIPQSTFQRCLTGDDFPKGRLVFGIDRSHQWENATITAAVKSEETIHTEIIATVHKPTKDKLLAMCLNLAKLNPLAFFMESYMLKELSQDLVKHGLKSYSLSTAEVCTASSTTFALCQQNRVKFRRDPVLIVQSPKGIAKYRGDVWRVAKSKPSDEIDSLMSTIFAVYGASREIETGPQLF